MSTERPRIEDYKQLLERAREATAELGEFVEDANRLGIGPLGLQEARAETRAIGDELASQMRNVMGIIESSPETGALDEEALSRAVDVLQNVSLRLRRILAPTNTHHLPRVSLAAIPFMLKGLPKLLLALSQESTLDPGLSGRLFMVASEIEFYGVLLSLETEREESAEEDNTDSATAAIDRVRQELENVAADGTGTDVALLRKRLNEALDEADSEDSALEEILTRVTETSEQIEVERSNLDHLVAMARERGASWNKIARAVGISAQSAHKRWDPEARAKARKYMQDYSVRRRDA
jgi:hypothetical protein